MDQSDVIAISDFARSKGVPVHLDGARIWHVAAETGISFKELVDPFDSVSVCFSKGLGMVPFLVERDDCRNNTLCIGAPVGSMLLGPTDFIKRARRFRKLFGGGLRQIGSLAGCAAYALNNNFEKLPKVHALRKRLEDGLLSIGAEIFVSETCMVFYDPSPLGLDYDEIAKGASELKEPLILGGSRLVVHIQTTEQAVEDFLALVASLAEQKKKEGWARPQTNGAAKVKDPFIRRAIYN